MPGPYVIDSSALAKTFLDEACAADFVSWLRDRLAAGDPLIAPSLVPYEIGEIVRQKKRSNPVDRRRVVEAAVRLVRLASHESVIPTVFDQPKTLSFYDAAFLALARLVGGTLVTYDRRLIADAVAEGVAVQSPGLP